MRRRKAFLYTLFYLLLVVFLRFVVSGRVVLVKEFLIFLGGALGALVLDFEERLMVVLGQPFDKPILRNVLCQVVLVFLAFYIGTSTVGFFPFGVVLGLLVKSLVEQYLELRGITSTGSVQGQSLGSWFWFVGPQLDLQSQKIYLGFLAFLLFYFSLILVGK